MSDKILVRSIEYPITEHCNLSCAHCDHASPLLDARFADLEQYRRDVHQLARFMRAREFLIIGGEPLLHPNLLEFLDIARMSGMSMSITLVTNGTLLHKAPAEMWSMIDRLWLSVYPKVASRIDLDEVTRICDEHKVVLDRQDIPAFRQTLINTQIENPDTVQAIYDRCAIAHLWHCYTLYDGRFFKCAPAPFMKARLKLRQIDINDAEDGVLIHDDPMLGDHLREYLTRDRPLAGCSYCLGSVGQTEPHRLLKKREVLEAIKRDDGPITRLINVQGLVEQPAWRLLRPAFHEAPVAEADGS